MGQSPRARKPAHPSDWGGRFACVLVVGHWRNLRATTFVTASRAPSALAMTAAVSDPESVFAPNWCWRRRSVVNAVNAYAYPVDQIAERFPPVYEALVDYESAFSYSGAVSRRVIGRAAW